MRLLTLALLLIVSSANAEQPNIVLIFADDLGWKDTSYNNSDYYETPNIDKLAKQGMTFEFGYASAGNCTPSRACMLSGQYTPRHHVYAVNSTKRGPEKLMRLEPIPNKSGLPKTSVTMADALKQAGYATGIFGKWHLDGPDGAKPTEQGFDVYFDSRWKNPNKKRDEPNDPKGIFSNTQAACEFIAKNKDKPFFCYLPYHAIHSSLEARPATLKRFQDKAKGDQHTSAIYAACTYDMDAGVGIILDQLDALKIADNTLVIFTSDNGATGQSSQEPLRGNKGCYYEGGIREPTIARWPGIIEPASQCSVPITNVDFYPTFVDVASAELPKDHPLDGESLVPLFKGTGKGKLKRDSVFWHFPGYLNQAVTRGRDPVFRTRPVTVIHQGPWKLHLYHEEWLLDGGLEQIATNHAVELYNLDDDPGERKDLCNIHVMERDRLLNDLLKWKAATGAKFAEKK